jgi:hydroxypyruvate isomerase
MFMRKITFVVLLAVALAACGGSKDKARELVESTRDDGFESRMDDLMKVFSSHYWALPDDTIRETVVEKLDMEGIRSLIVDVYADHFNNEELEVMIRANNKSLEETESILSSTEEGRALFDRVVEVQAVIDQVTEDAMKARTTAVIESLDKLNEPYVN